MTDLQADLALALDLAGRADAITMARFGALDLHVEHKPDLTPVSDADLAVETALRDALAAERPGDAIFGEEHGGESLPHGRQWVIDPVDGTKNFVAGSPDHAVMVAELVSGEVVRSWIWQPQHERAYVAQRGAGAWCDGSRLSRGPAGPEPRGVTSRRSWIGRALGPYPALELTWVCCGVDYPQLVQGAADYALYWRPSPWDHAPGSLLLTEAGGWLGTVDGEPFSPAKDQPGLLISAADPDTYERVAHALRTLPRG